VNVLVVSLVLPLALFVLVGYGLWTGRASPTHGGNLPRVPTTTGRAAFGRSCAVCGDSPATATVAGLPTCSGCVGGTDRER
jgi:hypothetical protein